MVSRVSEQSKSYVHGKIQDLAKYKREYEQCDDTECRQAIEGLIRSQFAEFDGAAITVPALYDFLVKTRGY